MSKKFTARLSSQANLQLDSLINYIAFDLENPFAAQKRKDLIIGKLHSLEKMPEQAPLISEEPYFSLGYRKAHVKNYIIIYCVDKIQAIIKIIAIGHSLQELKSYL